MTEGKVCIIGIWHLGAVYSACLADLGYRVVGFDRDSGRVADLKNGIPPLFEPGLKELIAVNIDAGRLTFTADLADAVRGADFVWITLDTPVDDNDEVELSPVFDATREIAGHLKNRSVVIISSQVPVGTCERLRSLIKERNPSLEFDVAYVPENLRLGQAVSYFKRPDRVVIGADSEDTLDRVETLLSLIPAPKLGMNIKSAEMTKHAINAFLATVISFANEMSDLCDETGADALKVAEALKSESRIGGKLPLLPGLAFAGGTLARDLKVLKTLAGLAGYEAHLIDGVLKVNERRNEVVIRKLHNVYKSLKGLKICILGLTYKPGTSTMRRSAALEIIGNLVNEGAVVRAYDPKADLGQLEALREFDFYTDPYLAAKDTDALIIVTEWPEFKSLDFDLIRTAMKNAVIVDTKNLLDDKQIVGKGFLYLGMGRGHRHVSYKEQK